MSARAGTESGTDAPTEISAMAVGAGRSEEIFPVLPLDRIRAAHDRQGEYEENDAGYGAHGAKYGREPQRM